MRLRSLAARARARPELLAALLVGGALRLAGTLHDLPFSYFGDELHLTKRAMAMGSGDLNPHWFTKGALLLYVLLGLYGTFYLLGRLAGRFPSPEAFGAYFLSEPGPFLVLGRLLVAGCGIAMIWLTYRLAAKVLDDRRAAGIAAFAVALLPPLVFASQHLKEDVPMAALALLATWLLFRGDRARDTLMAGAAAGLAIGVKATGLAIVPAMLAVVLIRARRVERPVRHAAARCGLLLAAVLAAAFMASPYQFLDRGFGHLVASRVEQVGGGETRQIYSPDAAVVYSPTPRWWARSAVAFARMLVLPTSLGPLLVLLVAAGLVASGREAATRALGAYVLVALLVFAALSIVVFPFHAAERHLTGLFPLLCVLIWPGARLLASALPMSAAVRTKVAWTLVAAALAVAAVTSVGKTRERLRLDSREVAYRWILQHLPADAGILVDEYGPPLLPDRRGVRRLEERLAGLPQAAFTVHQDQRVRLLREYPPAEGRDVEELGHQWWRPREATDAQLRTDPRDLAMGSPLVSRVPRPLDEYRRRGLRYVVTNSVAREQYRRKPVKREGFPSFVRFYRELEACPRVASFDPASWGGKGPLVWVYDLGPSCPPPSGEEPAGRAAAPARPSGR